jgi:hypothetical protein
MRAARPAEFKAHAPLRRILDTPGLSLLRHAVRR